MKGPQRGSRKPEILAGAALAEISAKPQLLKMSYFMSGLSNLGLLGISSYSTRTRTLVAANPRFIGLVNGDPVWSS